ncbi:MAG: hypothetical protein AMJ92_02255 [candidate division Zixibacteria bacterium SM23_81]|nr:MAG: hypothetical protein AMJ92_02255 [candidate division Zixibacteria bacterium SM23_81]
MSTPVFMISNVNLRISLEKKWRICLMHRTDDDIVLQIQGDAVENVKVLKYHLPFENRDL